MKIAVACEKEMVTMHFGHCEYFKIFQVKEGKIINSDVVANPGHRPGFLPVFLHEHGVKVIISGGMGAGAVEIFNEKGIEVITGVQGRANEVAERYVEGKLVSTGSICHDHQHQYECENDQY